MLRCKITLAALLLTASGLFAQTDTGVITGTVRDGLQGVLAGVRVAITNSATGIRVQLVTNQEGLYVSPPLRPGAYEIAAEREGFQRTVSSLTLELNQRASLDLELRVGEITQSVNVVAEAPLLERESAAVGVVRNSQTIQEIPLNLRIVTRIFELAPGVVPTSTQASGVPITLYRGVAQAAVNGVPERQNNNLVEGINNNENHNGVGVVVYPAIDALAEARVATSAFDAQFGRAAGGVMNVTFKSGGRDFHGNVFEYLRNSAMDARNFFDPPGQNVRFQMHQFGATFGGPLAWGSARKNAKSFFFASYDAVRRNQTTSVVTTLPLPEFVRGDFARLPLRIYDPLTTRASGTGGFVRDLFAGNAIPASRLDRVGSNVAKLYPEPNLPTLANNFVYGPVRRVNTDNGDIKLDRYQTERDWFAFRLSMGQTRAFDPPALPPPAIGAGPGFPGNFFQPHVQGHLSYTKTFRPTLVNEGRYGYSRLNLTSQHINFGRNLAQELGIPGVNVPGDDLTSGNLSTISVTGYQSLGDAGFLPALVISDNMQWSDNLSWTRSRHSFKFGGESLWRRYNAFQSSIPRGTAAFGRTFTNNPAVATASGDGLADLLLGVPQSSSINILNGTRGMRRLEFAGYAQDTWKTTDKLTLTLGLRYDIFGPYPWTEIGNRQANFLPDKGIVVPVGTPELPNRAGSRIDLNDFSPRFGFSYSVRPQTVLRGAYGFFYGVMYWDIGSNLVSNAPFAGRLDYPNNQFDFTGARPLSRGFDRPATFSALGGSVAALQQDYRTPSTQQFNLTLQHQLPGSVLVTLGYVGSKSTKWGYTRDINAPQPGSGAVAPRRQWPQYTSINYLGFDGNANYHSLQATLERRFSDGLGFQSAYTWSHCINDYEGLQDPRNRRGDRASCNLDLRHRFTTTANYELPLGRGKKLLGSLSSPANALVGGWQMNGVLNLYTGFPFSPNQATNTLNAPGVAQRADLVPGCDPADADRTVRQWFNPRCFTSPAPFTFGNAGRNILRGPGTAQLDFSLFKNVRFGAESARYVQFRAEFFNITNTPQFNNPNANIGTSPAGTISSAGSVLNFARTQRQIQLALKFHF
jgi:outer membrane receptor protein involved in Fe transport